MAVRLEAIQFNHDPSSAAGDALNLRRNATTAVSVPEWVRGASVNPEDSPAAYSIADTRGRAITIKARFSWTGKGRPSKVEVRAVDPTRPGPPSPWPWMWLFDWIRSLSRLHYGNVLGDVAARAVQFQPNGQSAFEAFQLKDTDLDKAGVGVRTTTWQWQYRVGGGRWTDIDVTQHRIYTVLETPKAPWQQSPAAASNTQLPWTDVLDYACGWASGSTTRDGAAGRVTQAVYGLPPTIEYDCPGGGASHYSGSTFDCTKFVERLRGGTGWGEFVNCSDCATIVSTFANILGCDLWQSRMGSNFALNPILAIGSSAWQTACGWGAFSYHEVAWKDGCTASDALFDACLQVDGDGDPTQAPHTPLLPRNLVFGQAGAGLYRDRLAAPSGRASCNPQPGTRKRRPVA